MSTEGQFTAAPPLFDLPQTYFLLTCTQKIHLLTKLGHQKLLAILELFKAPIKLEDTIQQGLDVKCAQACRVYFNKVKIIGLLYLFCGLTSLHQHE